MKPNRHTNAKKIHPFINFFSLKRLDVLGSEFQLKYSDSDKFQTSFGGCLSLIIIITVILASFTTTRNLISTTSPAVSVSYNTSNTVPKFDLYQNEIFIVFATSIDGGRSPLPPQDVSKYLTIKGFIETYDVSSDNNRYKRINFAEIDYIPCSQLKDKKPITALVDNEVSHRVLLGSYLCPELDGLAEKYFVQSQFQDPPNFYLTLRVYPCSLADRSQCASPSQFKSKNFLIYFSNVEKSIDVSNKKNPVKTNIHFNGIVKTSFGLEKNILNKLKNAEVRDDSWDFFEDRLNTEYVYYNTEIMDTAERDSGIRSCDYKNIQEKETDRCPPLLTMTFIGTGTVKTTLRRYAKFFGSLGEIGGTAEILILLSMIIYLGYNNYYLKKFIQEKMISSKSQKQLANILFPDDEDGEEMTPLSNQSGNNLENKHGKLRFGYQTTGRDLVGNSKTEAGSGLVKEGRPSLKKRKVGKGSMKGSMVSKEDQKIQKLKGLLDENIAENEDGMFLFRSLNTIRVLEGIMLEPHHKALLPAALMNMIKKRKEKEEKHQKEKEKGKRANFSQVAHKASEAKEQGESGENDQEMDLDEAYRRLISFEPKNQLQEMMNEFLDANLPEYFKKRAQTPNTKKRPQITPESSEDMVVDLSLPVEEKVRLERSSHLEKGKREEIQKVLSKKLKFSKSSLRGIPVSKGKRFSKIETNEQKTSGYLQQDQEIGRLRSPRKQRKTTLVP